MFCDKGMIEMFGIAKKELEIAYYRVMNSKYYDSHTVDSALNMFAKFVLDCNLYLREKESYIHQDKNRLIFFQDAQKKLERIYKMLSHSTLWDDHLKEKAFNRAVNAIEICEAIDLTPKEIEEN